MNEPKAIRQSAGWSGKGSQSRQALMNTLQV